MFNAFILAFTCRSSSQQNVYETLEERPQQHSYEQVEIM